MPCIALVALTTAPSPAQLLDLDTPEAPDVGEKAAAVALADTLGAQAGQLELKAEPAAAVRAEARRLAAALIRAGHGAGDAGATRLLAGRTLANHLRELDALAGGPWDDDVGRMLVLGDLRRARGRIPGDDEALDRMLRGALWRLGARRRTPPEALGWVETSPAPVAAGAGARDAVGLLRDLGAYEETMGEVERLLDLADEAASRPAFASGADRVRALLVGAAATLDDPPRWVEDEHIAAGARGVSRAAAAMLDPTGRDDARDRLARYDSLGPLIRRADALETTNDVRALRERLSAALQDPPPAPTLDALGQAFDLLDAVALGERDEKTLVRQLRPAWRWSRRAGVLAARALTQRLAAIYDTLDPLTDPGVLSDLAAVRTPIELGDALVTLSDRLDQNPAGPAGRPEAGGAWEAVADRVLRLSQDLGDPREGDAARGVILQITADLERAEALAAVGDERLITLASQARSRMIDAWSDEAGDPDAARPQLERIEGATRWIEDVALVEALPEGASLVQAWAAFELSPEAARALPGDAADRVARVIASLHGGDAEGADAMLGRLRSEHAAVAAVAALERRLRALTGRETADESWSVLAEIGSGPPDPARAWLVDQRRRVAELCARCEELAAASIRDDRPAMGDLRAALNTTGEALLRAVEGR